MDSRLRSMSFLALGSQLGFQRKAWFPSCCVDLKSSSLLYLALYCSAGVCDSWASQLAANAGCFPHFKPCIILWDNVKACPQKGSFQVSSNTVLLEGARFLRSQSFSFLVNKNVNILPTMRDQCLYPREEKSSSCFFPPHFLQKNNVRYK